MSGKEAEEQTDPQKLKRIAAAAYEYENDPRWAEYWSNILVPPHMASHSDVQDHFKRKFYQRYIDPNFVVEPMSSSNSSSSASSQSARPSKRSSSQFNSNNIRSTSGRSSQSATDSSRQNNSGPDSGGAAQLGRNTALRLDRRTIHFSVNAWVLIVAVLGMFPVVPQYLSNKAYRLTLLGTTCASIYSIYTLHGKPRAWNLPALQVWFQPVIASKDFIHFIYCLSLVTSQLHFKFALIPVFCWAIDHVAKFLRANFAHSSLYRRYLEEPCLWVETNGSRLSILSSHAEVGLGFLMIISLFSWQRNIIHTFMYWQLLKLMYHVPATSGYHQSVWAKIGCTAGPYIYRYAPFLNSPISMVQRWWFR